MQSSILPAQAPSFQVPYPGMYRVILLISLLAVTPVASAETSSAPVKTDAMLAVLDVLALTAAVVSLATIAIAGLLFIWHTIRFGLGESEIRFVQWPLSESARFLLRPDPSLFPESDPRRKATVALRLLIQGILGLLIATQARMLLALFD